MHNMFARSAASRLHRMFNGSHAFNRSATVRKYAVDRARIAAGPGLKEFLVAGRNLADPKRVAVESVDMLHPYLLDSQDLSGHQRKVFFEVYGCQMNVSDTEIVWAILKKADYVKVDDIHKADVVMLITCAIREGAETKVCYNRFYVFS